MDTPICVLLFLVLSFSSSEIHQKLTYSLSHLGDFVVVTVQIGALKSQLLEAYQGRGKEPYPDQPMLFFLQHLCVKFKHRT